MSKIIIHRKNEPLYRLTPFQIILNGRKIKNISPGESFTLEVSEGKYELKIKGGFLTKSNKLQFEINSGITREFTAEVFKKAYLRNHIRLSEITKN